MGNVSNRREQVEPCSASASIPVGNRIGVARRYFLKMTRRQSNNSPVSVACGNVYKLR